MHVFYCVDDSFASSDGKLKCQFLIDIFVVLSENSMIFHHVGIFSKPLYKCHSHVEGSFYFFLFLELAMS